MGSLAPALDRTSVPGSGVRVGGAYAVLPHDGPRVVVEPAGIRTVAHQAVASRRIERATTGAVGRLPERTLARSSLDARRVLFGAMDGLRALDGWPVVSGVSNWVGAREPRDPARHRRVRLWIVSNPALAPRARNTACLRRGCADLARLVPNLLARSTRGIRAVGWAPALEFNIQIAPEQREQEPRGIGPGESSFQVHGQPPTTGSSQTASTLKSTMSPGAVSR